MGALRYGIGLQHRRHQRLRIGVLGCGKENVARRFLNIVIRAIDYCPPLHCTFGEYLRAIVTADADLVPDDPVGYREAFDVLDSRLTLDHAIEQDILRSNQFARRQRTWFRAEPDVHWLAADSTSLDPDARKIAESSLITFSR